MTIFVIVVVIALAAVNFEWARRQIKKEKLRQATKTDIKTEKEYYTYWTLTIAGYLDSFHKGLDDDWSKVGVDDFTVKNSPVLILDLLYAYYDVPCYYAHEGQAWKDKMDKDLVESCKSLKSIWFNKYDEKLKEVEEWKAKVIANLEKNPNFYNEGNYTVAYRLPWSDNLIERVRDAKPLPFVYTGNSPDFFWEDPEVARLYDPHIVSDTKQSYKHVGDAIENRKGMILAHCRGDFREIPGQRTSWPLDRETSYLYILCSEGGSARYRRLIQLLVRKSLAGHGLKPSPYPYKGVDSFWQEREKLAKAYEEQRKKYPWL